MTGDGLEVRRVGSVLDLRYHITPGCQSRGSGVSAQATNVSPCPGRREVRRNLLSVGHNSRSIDLSKIAKFSRYGRSAIDTIKQDLILYYRLIL